MSRLPRVPAPKQKPKPKPPLLDLDPFASASVSVRNRPEHRLEIPPWEGRPFLAPIAAWPMTSEQAAELIGDTLDLLHERLLALETL